MNRTAVISAYIDETEGLAFTYGRHDCLLWAAGAVERLTGVDHAAPYRGRYATLAEGKRLIGTTLLRFVGERLPEIPPARAIDGDIAAVRQGREWAFGVFSGAFVYLPMQRGLGILPRRDAGRAFEVR